MTTVWENCGAQAGQEHSEGEKRNGFNIASLSFPLPDTRSEIDSSPRKRHSWLGSFFVPLLWQDWKWSSRAGLLISQGIDLLQSFIIPTILRESR